MRHSFQSLQSFHDLSSRLFRSRQGTGSVGLFSRLCALPALLNTGKGAKDPRRALPHWGGVVACILVLLGGGTDRAHAADARVEIDSLLAFVGRQQDIAFIRNGSSHTAQEAVSHLRFKRERAGSRLKTAEDFILHCATRSYLTRVPYRVKYRDGTTRKAADVLHEELRRLRAAESGMDIGGPSRSGT